ncbi:MAG: MoaD/ThiS family protein [Dehalococcoidia bacterium]
MGKVRLEIWPWLSRHQETTGFGRLVLEEDVRDGETLRDFLHRMGEGHRVFREVIFDPRSQQLSRQVTVIYNERLLELAEGLDTLLHDGDRLSFLPAFAGG